MNTKPELKIKTQDALEAFKGNVSAMARAFRVSRQAAQNWKREKYLPELRAYQFRAMFREKN